MEKSIFAKLIEGIACILRKYPKASTWISALYLSGVWTFTWLFVFFSTTWILDMETSAINLANVFFLSVAAESVIRYAENTKFVALISKPHNPNPRGDNHDFSFIRAAALFSIAALVMFLFDLFAEKSGWKDLPEPWFFQGQGPENGKDQIAAMLGHWWLTFNEISVTVPLFIGTVLRALIYKRSHQPPSPVGDQNYLETSFD